MITKTNAIQIAVAAYEGANEEKKNCFFRQEDCWAINGTLHRILGNLWYDVFPCGTREKFDYSYEKFIAEVEKDMK